MSSSVNSRVQAVVRVRPLLPRELVAAGVPAAGRGGKQQQPQSSIRLSANRKQVAVVGADKVFAFDNVFDEASSQEEVFNSTVRPLVEGCLNGYNATVLAYGQTGSGKTFTMGTSPSGLSGEATNDKDGITPRAVRHLFELIRTEHADKAINIRVSYLEIYNEEIRDLLHPEVQSREITIREDSSGRIFLTGAREEACASEAAVMRCLERGGVGRTTAETMMNDESSRSHAIFTISIDACDVSQPAQGGSAVKKYVQSKLQLVDLAGSERAKRTGASGVRLKESAGINFGLMALAKVIRALTSAPTSANATVSNNDTSVSNLAPPTNAFIPYRESKLTRYLQDSLGGNSRTLLVACITTSELSLRESLSTLQYAARAQKISNKLSANVRLGAIKEGDIDERDIVNEGLVAALRSQLSEAQQALALYQRQLKVQALIPHQFRRSIDGDDLDGSALLRASVDRIGQPRDAAWETCYALVQGIEKVEKTLRDKSNELKDLFEYIESPEYINNQNAEAIDGMEQLMLVSQVISNLSQELNDLHNPEKSAKTLGSILEKNRRNAPTNRSKDGSNTESNQGSSQKDLEILRLRGELEEARDDLRRDEEIFAEKMKELKQNKKKCEKLTMETMNLKNQLREANEAIAAMRLDVHGHQSVTASTSNNSSELRVSNEQHLKEAHDESRHKADHSAPAEDNATVATVAMNDPGMSQLLDDIDSLSREKDQLVAEKAAAEENAKKILSEAEAEKEVFQSTKATMQRRMKELEIAIKMKQEVISSLTHEQQKASGLAEKYEIRVRELEGIAADLQRQLQQINTRAARAEEEEEEVNAKLQGKQDGGNRSPSGGHRFRLSAQELERKTYVEEQLQLTQTQLIRLKSQREDVAANRSASDDVNNRHLKEENNLRKEIENMKREYNEITRVVQEVDQKQKMNMERMQKELNDYKREASDYKSKIKRLEAANAELQSGLDKRSLRAIEQRQRDVLAGRAPPSGADGPRYAKRHGTSTNASSPRREGSSRDGSVASPSKKNTISVPNVEWLQNRIKDLVALKLNKMEVGNEMHRLGALRSELTSLRAELARFEAQQRDGSGTIAKQIRDTEAKVAAMLGEIDSTKKAIAAMSQSQKSFDDADEEKRAEKELKLLSHVAELQKTMRPYQERIRELRVRQESGVLSESARGRMAEIKDEIEALETEIKVVENRIAQDGSVASGGPGLSGSTVAGVESAEPRAAARQLEVLRNHLLADIQRLDESSAIRLLLVMVNDAVETKFRLEQEDKSLGALKAHLQEVETARDELVRVIQKNNLEYSSKIDALKTENESKVAYLLQQLRVMEERVKQMPASKGSLSPAKKVRQAEELASAIAMSLGSRPSSASTSPVSVWANVVGRRSQSTPRGTDEDAVNVSSDSLVSAFPRHENGSSRPVTAPHQTSSSSKTRPQSATSVASAATEPGPTTDEELQRKWMAERQRREQLERRNVELARELRSLRSAGESRGGDA